MGLRVHCRNYKTFGAAIITPQSYHALVSGRSCGWWPATQRSGLWALSQPYGWAMGLRNFFYDRGWKAVVRANVPVVSVGNLSVGGTGKTPCVEYVARYYQQHDIQVAILSRGYGSSDGRNDEALVLEENLPAVPHLQGADRAALAAIAVDELETELIVLDDGFQHRRLARDLDIVLLDATQPWGHGYLLPRGLLREGPKSLRRAGVIVLTRCDQVRDEVLNRLHREIERYSGGTPIVEAVHRPVEWINSEGQTAPLELVQQRPAIAFCGLGNPEAFRCTLQSLGTKPASFKIFPDHHPYTRKDIAQLHTWARQQPEDSMVLTTQKDLVKLRLRELGGRPLWALRIGLEVVAGQNALHAQLERVARKVRRQDPDVCGAGVPPALCRRDACTTN
jgi:tetraacyldisaccharide 4'-kinase